MRKSTSILIEEDFDAFIDKKELGTALIEGEESGIAEGFDSDLFLRRMRHVELTINLPAEELTAIENSKMEHGLEYLDRELTAAVVSN